MNWKLLVLSGRQGLSFWEVQHLPYSYHHAMNEVIKLISSHDILVVRVSFVAFTTMLIFKQCAVGLNREFSFLKLVANQV